MGRLGQELLAHKGGEVSTALLHNNVTTRFAVIETVGLFKNKSDETHFLIFLWSFNPYISYQRDD